MFYGEFLRFNRFWLKNICFDQKHKFCSIKRIFTKIWPVGRPRHFLGTSSALPRHFLGTSSVPRHLLGILFSMFGELLDFCCFVIFQGNVIVSFIFYEIIYFQLILRFFNIFSYYLRKANVNTYFWGFGTFLHVKLCTTQLWPIARPLWRIEPFGSHVEVLFKNV